MSNYYYKYLKYKSKYQQMRIRGGMTYPLLGQTPIHQKKNYTHEIMWGLSNWEVKNNKTKVPTIFNNKNKLVPNNTKITSGSSKSGCDIYKFDNARYILKSLSIDEYSYLSDKSFLNHLVDHRKQLNENSLICPIFLLIRTISNMDSNPIYWILMKNLDTSKSILKENAYNSLFSFKQNDNQNDDQIEEGEGEITRSWKFDIKGSYINRDNHNDGRGDGNEGMDRNYINQIQNTPELKIPSIFRNYLIKILKEDIIFLIKEARIDYSLILKVNEKRTTDDNYKYEYKLGIIDYLENYNPIKKMEYSYKCLRYKHKYNCNHITIQPPLFYGKRLYNMIRCFIINNTKTCCDEKDCCDEKELINEYKKKYIKNCQNTIDDPPIV